MTEVATLVISLVLYVVTCATHPTHARCPAGWRVDGVSRDGTFVCDRPFGCQDHAGRRGGWNSECEGLISARSKVYCTGGLEPINVNGVDIACQARH